MTTRSGFLVRANGEDLFFPAQRETRGDAQRHIRAQGLDQAADFSMEYRDNWPNPNGTNTPDNGDPVLYTDGIVYQT